MAPFCRGVLLTIGMVLVVMAIMGAHVVSLAGLLLLLGVLVVLPFGIQLL